MVASPQLHPSIFVVSFSLFLLVPSSLCISDWPFFPLYLAPFFHSISFHQSIFEVNIFDCLKHFCLPLSQDFPEKKVVQSTFLLSITYFSSCLSPIYSNLFLSFHSMSSPCLSSHPFLQQNIYLQLSSSLIFCLLSSYSTSSLPFSKTILFCFPACCFSLSHNLPIHLLFLALTLLLLLFSAHKLSGLFISLTSSSSFHPSSCCLPDSGDSGGQTGSGHLDSPPHTPANHCLTCCVTMCVSVCVYVIAGSCKRAGHEELSVMRLHTHIGDDWHSITIWECERHVNLPSSNNLTEFPFHFIYSALHVRHANTLRQTLW